MKFSLVLQSNLSKNIIWILSCLLDFFGYIITLKLHLTQHCGRTVFRLTGVCVSNHNNNTFVIICISIGDRLFGNLGSYFGFCWCQLEIPGDCQKRSLHAKSTFQSHIQHPSWDLLTFFASLYSEKIEWIYEFLPLGLPEMALKCHI